MSNRLDVYYLTRSSNSAMGFPGSNALTPGIIRARCYSHRRCNLMIGAASGIYIDCRALVVMLGVIVLRSLAYQATKISLDHYRWWETSRSYPGAA